MVQSEYPECMQYNTVPEKVGLILWNTMRSWTVKLSLSSNIPLYAQLVGIIKREISSGALAIGDLLPSEAELCRALDISRNTARQAIGELEEEGLVVRKRGKGTFVADPNTNRRGVRYSFTTEVSSLGKTPSSTLVDFGVVIPTGPSASGWTCRREPRCIASPGCAMWTGSR